MFKIIFKRYVRRGVILIWVLYFSWPNQPAYLKLFLMSGWKTELFWFQPFEIK